MNKKKILCAILCAVLAVQFCSCGDSDEEILLSGKSTDEYPQSSDVELIWWVDEPAGVRMETYTMNSTMFKKELEKQTGIRVKFIHPPWGQEVQSFSLMIASNNLPDIIEYDWKQYAGGAGKAIADDVIVDIKPLLEKVSPNLKAFLDERPEIAKNLQTDQGQYGFYPFVRDGDMLTTFRGAVIRKDILDNAGVAMPETLEEWDIALRTMKDAGIEIPITIHFANDLLDAVGPFMGAFDICGGFYQEDGVVKFGPYEPNFKKFVKKMNEWYEEGLLDRQFDNMESSRYGELFSSGKLGAAFGTAGGNMGNWISDVQQNIPGAVLAPAKYPSSQKGQRAKFGHKTLEVEGKGAAITTQCRDVEMAARLLDYAYSEEGSMLYNFGIEGESYEMVDGYPTYTSYMTDEEINGGRTLAQMLGQYTRSSASAPCIQDVRYMEQYCKGEEQKAALRVWADTDAGDYQLPLLTFTLEENTEYSSIMNKINPYRQERLYQYIAGILPVDDMEEYYAELQNMGIERAIEIQQAAYDRFLQR